MKKTPAALLVMSLILTAFVTGKKGNGAWQAIKTKNGPGGRSECSMAVVNGRLYLIGGDAQQALPVVCLDPKTLTWTKLKPAPVVMHHFQLVAFGRKIYALQAFSSGSFPNQEPMPNVYVYDTYKDTWQKGGEMPATRRRAGAGAALYNGKLYLVAGIQHGHSSGTNSMFDEYDPVTGIWKPLPNAPHIRDHCFATVISDKLYVAGGRNTSFRDPSNKLNFFSQVELNVDCYDFKTAAWSTLSAKLPLGTGGGALVNLNNRLYYMGGERATATEQNGPRKNTYYLDPATDNAWTATGDLNQARNGTSAAVIDGKIYLAGGAGGGPGGPGGPPPNGQRPGAPGAPPQAQGNPPPGGPGPGDTAHMRTPGAPGSGPQGSGPIALEVFIVKK